MGAGAVRNDPSYDSKHDAVECRMMAADSYRLSVLCGLSGTKACHKDESMQGGSERCVDTRGDGARTGVGWIADVGLLPSAAAGIQTGR